ncbi:MAG: ATP-binding cassette domain-containing protein [Elusimicrobiota bacterium]
MSGLLFVLRREKGRYARILLLGLVVNTGMTLLGPLFLKQLFDRCIPSKDMRLFVALLSGFMVLATAYRLMNLWQNLEIQKLKNSLCRSHVGDLLRKYYRLPYAETIRFAPGYFSSRIFDEPLTATASAVDLTLAVADAASAFAASAILLAFLSLHAAALLGACVPPLLWLARRFGASVKTQADAEKESESALRGFIAKSAQAYRSVRLFALSNAVFSALNARLDDFMGRAVSRLRTTSVHNTLSAIFMSYAEMLVTIVCGYEMMHGRMTFGGFMAFMGAFWTAVNAMRTLAQKAPELARQEAVIDRMRAFLAAPEAVEKGAAGTIRLRDVSAGYGGAEVLTRLSLEIRGGEKILLSGRNGSGKSTLAGLLMSFLTPMEGVARIPKLERVSACMAPHPFIPGTVGDNLERARMTPPQAAYLDALLRDFGLSGVIDTDPEALSSGQRKKIEVVQALLKNADLYIFDEPLANVDAESKEVMLERIFERTAGRALIVVMHGDDELKTRFDRAINLDERTPAALTAA